MGNINKLSKEKILEIRKLAADNPAMTAELLAKKTGVSATSVRRHANKNFFRGKRLNIDDFSFKDGFVIFKHGNREIKIDLLCLEFFRKKRLYVTNLNNFLYLKKANGTYFHRELLQNPTKLVDHINRDTLDNRLCNLRIVERWQNNVNCLRKSKFGLRGIYPYNTKNGVLYKVQIKVHGVMHKIYRLKTLNEAKVEYNKLAKKLHGEFAYQYDL